MDPLQVPDDASAFLAEVLLTPGQFWLGFKTQFVV
jgi:hypothetical protein